MPTTDIHVPIHAFFTHSNHQDVFALAPLALSFLTLTTSVIMAPVASEDTLKRSTVDLVDKRAYYYYSGPEEPAENDKHAYYYYSSPEEPAKKERHAYYYYYYYYYYYLGPEQHSEEE
ncbi:hypothetical protein TSTA_113360 [Talaromyces stipitatus ATCC 10500]|uniref:Uncharacterized protein n=1 Tax=Talaromyces stipitatus (strain ATCC 10500 / CBS 375.48 / QM 6759 / NRRL 1006) TaxID=441959 RepID=B8MCY4_TALSN|nr:uncharacterized protein TSTA_113360 [Talaromyces stipitatus ATCC 10500]EED17510.1 hypothetical protein TSTA_113360 [Talaromyces stipitatus ATCC 10500]